MYLSNHFPPSDLTRLNHPPLEVTVYFLVPIYRGFLIPDLVSG